MEPRVVSAVDGHDESFNFAKFSHLIRGRWWDADRFKPGAFGCFLSHAKCWRQVRDGSTPLTLICEDDLVVEPGPFATLVSGSFPDDFDIIFINAGLVRFIEEGFEQGARPSDRFLRVDQSLMRLVEREAFTDLLTPGSYGYIMSQTGASKMLELMQREKVCLGADYAMVFGSLPETDLERIREHPARSRYLEIYLENCADDARRSTGDRRPHLTSYIWNGDPVIRHRSEFGSSINHQKFLSFDVFENSLPHGV